MKKDKDSGIVHTEKESEKEEKSGSEEGMEVGRERGREGEITVNTFLSYSLASILV